jgi:hypothetical protein
LGFTNDRVQEDDEARTHLLVDDFHQLADGQFDSGHHDLPCEGAFTDLLFALPTAGWFGLAPCKSETMSCEKVDARPSSAWISMDAGPKVAA